MSRAFLLPSQSMNSGGVGGAFLIQGSGNVGMRYEVSNPLREYYGFLSRLSGRETNGDTIPAVKAGSWFGVEESTVGAVRHD